jgi:AcrR family transcriptional regulator
VVPDDEATGGTGPSGDLLADEVVGAPAAGPDADPGCGTAPAGCAAGRRRRGEALEQAILDAALVELSRHGIGALTMEGVAAAAATGKASLYRRWGSKEELVLDALARAMPPFDDVSSSSGSLRQDLHTLLHRMATFIGGPEGAVMRSVLGTVDPDDELLAALRERLIEPRLRYAAGLIAQAVERGEIPPPHDVRVVAQVGPGVLMHRFMMYGRVTAADVDEVIDQVVLPLLRRGREPASRPA